MDVLQSNPLYVRIKELKVNTGSLKNKNRVVKFFLVDQEGNEQLVVVGEDQGDAHYFYHSHQLFDKKWGQLACHNRKKVIEWLEMIIHESQLRNAGENKLMQECGNSDCGLKEGQNTQYSAQHTTSYLRHELDKCYLDDGRKCSKWFLIDQHNRRHLAVVGEERDTRDGHYTYRAEGEFKEVCSLSCTNVRDVYHYLEQFLTHRVAGAALVAGQDVIVQDPHHYWSSTPQFVPQSVQSKPKSSLVMSLQAKSYPQNKYERQSKKQRMSGKFQHQLTTAVNEINLKSKQEIQLSSWWLYHAVSTQQAAVVQFWVKLLQSAIQDGKNKELDGIEALRELHRMPMTLSMICLCPNLIDLVNEFIKQHPSYWELGNGVIRKWQNLWLHSTLVGYNKDQHGDVNKELECVMTGGQLSGPTGNSGLEESIGYQSSQQETVETEGRTASKSVPPQFAEYFKNGVEK